MTKLLLYLTIQRWRQAKCTLSHSLQEASIKDRGNDSKDTGQHEIAMHWIKTIIVINTFVFVIIVIVLVVTVAVVAVLAAAAAASAVAIHKLFYYL